MLAQRRRRWANISPALGQRAMFSGKPLVLVRCWSPSFAMIASFWQRGPRWGLMKRKQSLPVRRGQAAPVPTRRARGRASTRPALRLLLACGLTPRGTMRAHRVCSHQICPAAMDRHFELTAQLKLRFSTGVWVQERGSQAITRSWPTVGTLLGQHCRRWDNSSPTVDQRPVYISSSVGNSKSDYKKTFIVRNDDDDAKVQWRRKRHFYLKQKPSFTLCTSRPTIAHWRMWFINTQLWQWCHL